LNVFSDNATARRLCKSLGYEETDVQMSKRI
jgi:hypothetical protein